MLYSIAPLHCQVIKLNISMRKYLNTKYISISKKLCHKCWLLNGSFTRKCKLYYFGQNLYLAVNVKDNFSDKESSK